VVPVAGEITDERSIQTRMADDLRARIELGEYAPGSQLPTYEQLRQTYLCSVGVARKAIDLLRQQGLVVSKQGKGVFVRERARPKRHGIERYARSRWKTGGTAIHDAEAGGQGLRVKQLYREIGETPAPPEVAEAFGISPGTLVVVRRRTTIVDGRPHQLADSYYPLDLAKGTLLMEESSGPGGGFARLDEAGEPLAEISEEWSARMPTSPESVALQLPGGTPVMDLTRIVYDAMGRAVEVMLAVIAADTVRMTYRFPIPD
jgi:GntR family transcriptional regulator